MPLVVVIKGRGCDDENERFKGLLKDIFLWSRFTFLIDSTFYDLDKIFKMKEMRHVFEYQANFFKVFCFLIKTLNFSFLMGLRLILVFFSFRSSASYSGTRSRLKSLFTQKPNPHFLSTQPLTLTHPHPHPLPILTLTLYIK